MLTDELEKNGKKGQKAKPNVHHPGDHSESPLHIVPKGIKRV